VTAPSFRTGGRYAPKRWVIAASCVGLGVAMALLGAPAGASPVPGSAPCPMLPADNVWHADISALPVNAHSGAWMGNMGASTTRLHPDFGPSGEAMPYGIPYNVVAGSHSKVTPTFDYADESDPGPYPFGADTPIEGGAGSGGDQHALMVDKDTCKLYELYAADWNNGHPTAGSGAVFDLRGNGLRPATWTSADAAGLPILPGLLRLDEVRSGNVDHAVRFTAQRSDRSYLWPARHQAGSANDPNLPPMGARFRLKSSFDISRLRGDTQVILRAFKTYGLMLADNGSNWFFQGTAEDGWDTGLLDELKAVPASAFEAVDESSLMADPNSGQVKGSPSAGTPQRGTTPKPKPVTSGSTGQPATTAPTVPVATPVAPTSTEPTVTTTTTGPSGGVAAPRRLAGHVAQRSNAPLAALAVVLAGTVGTSAAILARRRRQ
jgi:hypothetical protein